MIFRVRVAATLAFCCFAAVMQPSVEAQVPTGRRQMARPSWSGVRPSAPAGQDGPAMYSVAAAKGAAQSAYYQPATPTKVYHEPPASGPGMDYYQPQTAVPQDGQYIEELPHVEGQYIDVPYTDGQTMEDPFVDDPSMDVPYVDGQPILGPYDSGDFADGGYYTDGGYGYDAGCCEECGRSGDDCVCWYLGGVNLNPLSWVCPPGRYYVIADYLYVRSNFSDSVAYLIQDDSAAPTFSDEFRELEFEYESSYRVGGGYFMECCDEQIRFLFTRLSSSAEDFTDDPRAVGPFETSPGPEGNLNIAGEVDAKSWDLEFAKTIRLGGGTGCGCGDPCGCQSGYPCDRGGCGAVPCAPWAITWSGGLRFAEVDWERAYLSNNTETQETRNALSTMEFEGGGPRVGLEGRRFFGCDGWGSVYVRGDISLLLGHVDLFEGRTVSDEILTTPDTVFSQTARFRNIIPVTEIEAGLSAQVTCNASLTAGYLFSAWHDLGFRDQFDFATFLATNYDDANILSFDGFFARFEWLF